MTQVEDEVKIPENASENWWKCANGLKIENNVLKYNSSYYCGAGSKLIANGKHEWILRYDSTSSENPRIGIASQFDNLGQNLYRIKYNVCYLCDSTKLIYTYLTGSSYVKFKSNLPQIKSGSKIKLLLDLEKNEISFYLPFDNKLPVATVPNLPKVNGWRLVGALHNSGESWTIISSKSLNVLNIPDLGEVNNVIKLQLDNLNNKNNYNKITNTIKSFKLDKLLKSKQDINKFKISCKLLNENCKQYLIKLNELESVIDKQIKPDPLNYKNWKAKEIVRYIISYQNGIFNKYSQILEKNMVEEELDGTDLCDITKPDLKSFGITNFKDRTKMYKAIQQIINGEEGNQTETDLH